MKMGWLEKDPFLLKDGVNLVGAFAVSFRERFTGSHNSLWHLKKVPVLAVCCDALGDLRALFGMRSNTVLWKTLSSVPRWSTLPETNSLHLKIGNLFKRKGLSFIQPFSGASC